MFIFEIDPNSEQHWRRAVQSAVATAGDMSKLQQPLYDDWFTIEELELFKTEGASGADGPWKPLSPAYAKWKTDKYGNLLMEQLSGDLGLSLTNKDAPNAIYRLTADNMIEYGSDKIYAMAQHSGRPEINLPARPLISLTAGSLDRAVAVIAKIAADNAAKEGFDTKIEVNA